MYLEYSLTERFAVFVCVVFYKGFGLYSLDYWCTFIYSNTSKYDYLFSVFLPHCSPEQ